MNPITKLLIDGTIDTSLMVIISLFLAYLFGMPLGILLVITKKGGLMSKPKFHFILGTIINLLRSLPFIILMLVLIPFTRFIIGTSIGVLGTIVPLAISATPFVARMIETSLEEIDTMTVKAAEVMGASLFQIIIHVYIKESIPSIIRNVPIVMIALIGYSAMAGATGGGGLGDIAIRYGYYNYDYKMMIMTLIIIIIMVQVTQIVFTSISKKIDKRK